MNVNDTEIIWSMQKTGFKKTNELKTADVILLVICAIREGAEQQIWNQLELLKGIKRIRKTQNHQPPLKIGLLGCMAKRLKHMSLDEEQLVDLIAGPDSYKDLPRLLELADPASCIPMETYPERRNKNNIVRYKRIN